MPIKIFLFKKNEYLFNSKNSNDYLLVIGCPGTVSIFVSFLKQLSTYLMTHLGLNFKICQITDKPNSGVKFYARMLSFEIYKAYNYQWPLEVIKPTISGIKCLAPSLSLWLICWNQILVVFLSFNV